MGEEKHKAVVKQNGTIALETFGGQIHVEWDPSAAVTPLGELPFFIAWLKVSRVFEAWVADYPLAYPAITRRIRARGCHRAAIDPRRPSPRRAYHGHS